MARPHIPDLANIQFLQNLEIKFYAAIGAAVSLTAGLEIALYDIFEKATGLKQLMAAKVFYGTQNVAARREIAFSAMNEFLLGRTSDEVEWALLANRIIAATGRSADRHLVAHNVVHMNTTITLGGPPQGAAHGFGEAFGPLGQTNSGATSKSEFMVSQDQIQIIAGKRKADQTDFDSLIKFCNEIIALLNDLDGFLARL